MDRSACSKKKETSARKGKVGTKYECLEPEMSRVGLKCVNQHTVGCSISNTRQEQTKSNPTPRIWVTNPQQEGEHGRPSFQDSWKNDHAMTKILQVGVLILHNKTSMVL